MSDLETRLRSTLGEVGDLVQAHDVPDLGLPGHARTAGRRRWAVAMVTAAVVAIATAGVVLGSRIHHSDAPATRLGPGTPAVMVHLCLATGSNVNCANMSALQRAPVIKALRQISGVLRVEPESVTGAQVAAVQRAHGLTPRVSPGLTASGLLVYVADAKQAGSVAAKTVRLTGVDYAYDRLNEMTYPSARSAGVSVYLCSASGTNLSCRHQEPTAKQQSRIQSRVFALTEVSSFSYDTAEDAVVSRMLDRGLGDTRHIVGDSGLPATYRLKLHPGADPATVVAVLRAQQGVDHVVDESRAPSGPYLTP